MPTFNTTDPKPGYVYDSATDTWFPLVGIAPASQVDRWTKTAAGGETSLSGNDDNAVSLSYTSGTEQVYLNGVLLVRGQDYTATNGTTITGLTALAASDVAEVVTFNPSNILTTDAVIATDFEAKGDLISASAASTPIRLPVGTTGQVLKANSATTSGLEWGTVDADITEVVAGTGLSGGGTSGSVTLTNTVATTLDAAGDIIYASAADTPAKLSIGTASQILAVNSGATAPEWITPSGGMTLISETTASDLSSLSLSSIPQTYKQLMLVWNGIYHSAASNGFSIRLNSATGNYYTKAIGIDTASFTYEYRAGTDITASSVNIINPFGRNITGTGDLIIQANGFFLIDNYASTTKVKTYNYDFGFYNGANKGLMGTGVFGTTTAVTSIDIYRQTGAGTFSNDTNTSIRLYGIS
jgi:hypothetical protein